MKCIYCGCSESRVIDSRPSEDGEAIRRRRECEGCGRRFTTYEKVDPLPLMVVKKDQRREAFDSAKIKLGVVKACEKRPVSYQMLRTPWTISNRRCSIPTSGRSRPFMWANLPCRS